MPTDPWLTEARQIVRGESLRMPVVEHLKALQRHVELLERAIKNLLEDK